MRPPLAASLVTPARRPGDIQAARTLLSAYFRHIADHVDPNDAESELVALPGPFAAPGGTLLIAWFPPGHAVGCAGLRSLDRPGTCELKRLYVAPAGRGKGIGRALVTAAVASARTLGYGTIVLDTLPTMPEAARLYRSLGFTEIPPYHATGAPGTLYFHLPL